jgi:hypothetical protein
VPFAGLAEAGLLALKGVGGVTLLLLLSAAADLRPKKRNFCSDQEPNHATYQDLQPKQRIPAWNQRDRFLLRPACQHCYSRFAALSDSKLGWVSGVGARMGGRKKQGSRCVGVGRCEQTAQHWAAVVVARGEGE